MSRELKHYFDGTRVVLFIHDFLGVTDYFYRCVHEYVDVYSEVQQVDTEDLIKSPFGGRYCGLIPPRDRTSLYRIVAFSFYTDKNSSTSMLFNGFYTFKNDCELILIL